MIDAREKAKAMNRSMIFLRKLTKRQKRRLRISFESLYKEIEHISAMATKDHDKLANEMIELRAELEYKHKNMQAFADEVKRLKPYAEIEMERQERVRKAQEEAARMKREIEQARIKAEAAKLRRQQIEGMRAQRRAGIGL